MATACIDEGRSAQAQALAIQPSAIGPSARFFEQFSVGDNWISPKRTITETDVVTFTAFSGDCNPIHTDTEFAKGTIYGERLLHGPAGFAIAIGLEAQLGIKEGTAIAFLGMTWNMKGPIRIGDTIHVRQEVKAARKTRRPGRGIVTFHVELFNQHGEVVQDGEWMVMMSCEHATA